MDAERGAYPVAVMTMKKAWAAAWTAAAAALRLLLPGGAAAVRDLLLAPPAQRAAEEAYEAFARSDAAEQITAVFGRNGG